MTESSKKRSRLRRLRQITRTYLAVFMTVLVLGILIPVLIAFHQAGEETSRERGVASMILHSETLDTATGLTEIVQETALSGIRIIDSSGRILISDRIPETGQSMAPKTVERIDKQESGYFSFRADVGGRTVTISGMKDDLSDRMVVLTKPVRSPVKAALPLLAAGLILSLAVCLLIAIRAWSWSSSVDEAAGELENALHEAARGGVPGSPARRIEQIVQGGPFEFMGEHLAQLLARMQSDATSRAEQTVDTMFDANPHPAYIRTPDGRILATNRPLRDEIDRTADQLEGESETLLQRVLPIDRVRMLLDRKGFRNRGIRGLLVSPSSNRLTILPITYRGIDGHIVVLEMNARTVHTVRGDGPETPRGLRMAIELAESEGRLQMQRDAANLIASNEISSGLADLYGATDLAVWAIDENGRTLHWSRAARRFTGVWKRDIPDVEAFSRMILTDEEQRQVLLRWLEGDATRLSRQLVCRLDDGTPIGVTWHADETLVRTRPGEMKRVTVLWCKTPIAEESPVQRRPL